MKPLLISQAHAILLASAALVTGPTALSAAEATPAPEKTATEAKPASGVKVGSAVTTDALRKSEWIQGESPAEWEPGKVYLLECWATWCGPCVAAIPHVNELHKKYSDKGLRVIGMNVRDDKGKAPVVEFVKRRGDGMSYPVAFNAEDSAFETEWFPRGGVSGIPTTFVVKDGKIVLICHPMQLTDEVIGALLAGGEGQEKITGELNRQQSAQNLQVEAILGFQAANRKGDVEAMVKKIEELRAIDPQNENLPAFSLLVVVAKGDWAAIEAAVDQLDDSEASETIVHHLIPKVITDNKVPASLVKKLLPRVEDQLADRSSPYDCRILAIFRWKAGNQEAAILAAKKAVVQAGAEPGRLMELTPEPFQKFVDALEKGALPSDAEFETWLRDAREKAPH